MQKTKSQLEILDGEFLAKGVKWVNMVNKLEKLEAENRRLMNEVADYSDECHELIQQTVDLEAENKRLREALTEIDNWNDSISRYDAEINRIIKEALNEL